MSVRLDAQLVVCVMASLVDHLTFCARIHMRAICELYGQTNVTFALIAKCRRLLLGHDPAAYKI